MDNPSLHTDIDECERDTDNCHVNATCADVIGSFVCTCNSGFEGNGVNCIGKKFPCIFALGGNFPSLTSRLYGLTICQEYCIACG